MKTALLFLLLTTALCAQEPRPKTPTDSTLAAPTSQIAAWYRYAVYLESTVATLIAERDKAVAVSEALLGVRELRAQLDALKGQVVPADDYAKLNERLQAALQHNMFLAGQLNKKDATQ
jgi:hypothetical protein